jgi:predicted metal-dependent hydrolase
MKNMKKKTTYKLLHSNRKTIAIHITKEAEVVVRAPFKAKQKDIDNFVAQKRDWIERHLVRIKEAQGNRLNFELNYGDQLRLMGKKIFLVERKGDKVGYDGQCFYLPPRFPPCEIKNVVISLYKQIAKQVLTDRTLAYAGEVGVMPTAVKVNSAKTRWGSCSSKSSINYSWRLIMAANEIIDYVIIHELAHIKELNHSPSFWAIVESVLPDYKKRQKKLKEFQKEIAHEDWE